MKRLNEVMQKKVAAMAFGRFNPPTANHQKMIERLVSESKNFGATPHVFISHAQDMEDNPLSVSDRIKYLRLAMPNVAENFVYNSNILTTEDAINHLVSEGYTDVVVVLGESSDDVSESLAVKYKSKIDSGESLYLESLRIVETYEADPDSEFAAGVNSAQMRDYAAVEDFETFKKGAMAGLSEKYVKEMFETVVSGMNTLNSLEEQIDQIPDSLNIPRCQMPQIKKDDINEFIGFLKSNGIKVEEVEMEVSKLKPTQNEINLNKVKIKYDDFRDNATEMKPFMVSKDDHILDGHHQLYALKSLNTEMRVKAHKIDYPMLGIIDFAKRFPKTTYKSINEDQYATDAGYYKKRRALRKKSEIRRTRERQKKERQELRDKQFAEIQKARQLEYEKDKKTRGAILDN